MVVLVGADDLRGFAKEVLMKVRVPQAYARTIVDHLVLANLRGVDSHGVIRLPYYVKGIEEGMITPNPKVRAVVDGDVYALLDGDNGLGQVAAKKATDVAIAKALENGIGLVGVRNLRHTGMLAYYVLRILEKKMVGVAITNASPNIAPLGCKKPIVGTNPLAVGLPVEEGPPLLLDMATSFAAKGKILLAAKKGEKIPEGWAMDKNGKVTTDPEKAIKGTLLPIGGHKGFGLALVIDALCGVVFGGEYGLKLKKGRWFLQGGFLVLAVKIDAFRPYNDYLKEMKEYIRAIKSAPTTEGTEILLPGEPEARVFRERARKGIPLDEDVFRDLSELSKKFGVNPPKQVSP